MPASIGTLITNLRGTRTYEQLAQDCGGQPTAGRIQQLATKPQSTFPSPESIKGLSKGLRCSTTAIINACAHSLDLVDNTDVAPLVALLPPGAQNLTQAQVNTVLTVISQFVHDNEVEASAVTSALAIIKKEEANHA
ncbi:hypothetical protein ACMX2H_16150 [Arthrobacter sulfonylureivorans]|uniref:hypothetical protein n=1 Tax=Arthrobacter sulfonylureivorans TaxID=2486855 RepID=UPI0039E4224D